ncbi:DUF6270 domain-containing protein [Janibacter terrae]|uniref:DUF6270 domain-containing protein n=1 Tax=Janibacter terrae TaxID=103817 RepID=UPI0009ED0E4B|nr:DUF6270 domain-containing protein [Janibacter terrae]
MSHGVEGTQERVRTFIYGSCVSRDTLEVMGDTHEVLRYVARQSAISVAQPAAGVAEQLAPIASSFQERMVRGDIEGNLLSELTTHADSIDQLVIDLIDERSGVVATSGGYVTRLSEIWSAGGARATRGGEHLQFGTDAHFALWSAAMTRIVAAVDQLGLLDRTVSLRTPWAAHDDSGHELDVPEWMMAPEEANQRYRRYYDRLERLVPMIDLPSDLAVSPVDHRWGASPFHYSTAAYEYLAEQLRLRVVS